MITSLTFNDVPLYPVNYLNQPWIRGSQIEAALGFSKAGAIKTLYARHADEFTPAMTALVKLSTKGGEQETRIFSLRGCHLLAMFARTPVAKEFRRWVLDVLDKIAADEAANRQALPDTITPAQQNALQRLVKMKAESFPPELRPKGLYPQVWSRFNNHFKLGSYKQLPQAQFDEAVAYIEQMEIAPALPASAPALPAAPLSYAERCAAVSDQMRTLRREALDVGHNMAEIFCNPFWKGAVREGQLPPEQREFATAMNYAVHSFWMCLHSNFEVVNLLFTAYVEAEKLLNSAEKS